MDFRRGFWAKSGVCLYLLDLGAIRASGRERKTRRKNYEALGLARRKVVISHYGPFPTIPSVTFISLIIEVFRAVIIAGCRYWVGSLSGPCDSHRGGCVQRPDVWGCCRRPSPSLILPSGEEPIAVSSSPCHHRRVRYMRKDIPASRPSALIYRGRFEFSAPTYARSRLILRSARNRPLRRF